MLGEMLTRNAKGYYYYMTNALHLTLTPMSPLSLQLFRDRAKAGFNAMTAKKQAPYHKMARDQIARYITLPACRLQPMVLIQLFHQATSGERRS